YLFSISVHSIVLTAPATSKIYTLSLHDALPISSIVQSSFHSINSNDCLLYGRLKQNRSCKYLGRPWFPSLHTLLFPTTFHRWSHSLAPSYLLANVQLRPAYVCLLPLPIVP